MSDKHAWEKRETVEHYTGSGDKRARIRLDDDEPWSVWMPREDALRIMLHVDDLRAELLRRAPCCGRRKRSERSKEALK